MTLIPSVKHLTSCRPVGNYLNKLGHCCSYTDWLGIETLVAINQLQSNDEHCVLVPADLLATSLGFIQASANNDDFKEDTLDGKGPTRGTTVIRIQQ